jgi:hypothetical protein
LRATVHLLARAFGFLPKVLGIGDKRIVRGRTILLFLFLLLTFISYGII